MSLDPEPSIEYVLDTVWQARLVSLGFTWTTEHPHWSCPSGFKGDGQILRLVNEGGGWVLDARDARVFVMGRPDLLPSVEFRLFPAGMPYRVFVSYSAAYEAARTVLRGLGSMPESHAFRGEKIDGLMLELSMKKTTVLLSR